MDNNTITTHSEIIKPLRAERLGDIQINETETSPLGGLNPYNPHFESIGKQFLNLLITYAHLTPNNIILDLGCGTGRLTKPITQFIHNGKYYGLDINDQYINYCNNNYKNCKFTKINVQHDEYNNNGTINPNQIELPYKDRSIDIVIAIALFNHLKLSWVQRYISQISRVLKPRGILFCTAILLNERTKNAIQTRDKPPFQFSHKTDDGWCDYKTRPLFNIALPEDSLRRTLIKSRLIIKEPIRYGEWSGANTAITGHDVIIAKKNGWENDRY